VRHEPEDEMQVAAGGPGDGDFAVAAHVISST
jgi:hypothetical protein